MSSRQLIRKRKYVRKSSTSRFVNRGLLPYSGAPSTFSRVSTFNIPPAVYSTLRYCSTYVWASPLLADTCRYRTFCGNGLFDPDITGGGHQPMGFDQYMSLYARFCVYAYRVILNFSTPQEQTAYAPACQFGFCPMTTGASYTSPDNAREACSIVSKRTYLPTSITSPWIDIASQYNVTRKQMLLDHIYSGNAAANPTRPANFNIYQIAGSTQVDINWEMSWTIEFKTKFYDPQPPNGS